METETFMNTRFQNFTVKDAIKLYMGWVLLQATARALTPHLEAANTKLKNLRMDEELKKITKSN